MSWTDERVNQLTQMWGEGKTAAEIAKLLGGVSRNAVIGKAHRLKLSGRVSPIQQNNTRPEITQRPPANEVRQSRPVAKERIVAAPVLDAIFREETIEIKGIKLTELRESTCRWPVGDPKEADFKFCGCHASEGMTYCNHHSRLAYQVSTRGKLKVDDLARIDSNIIRKVGNQ